MPEDARARILLSLYYSQQDRIEDAMREANLAMVLRPDDGAVLYNAACVYCNLNKKTEAMDALVKAHKSGMRDPTWARQDPDLALLHGEPELTKSRTKSILCMEVAFMTMINVHEAKTHLSRILDRVAGGEEILIAKAGKPIARLVPVAVEKKPRIPGTYRGKIRIRDDFDAPLPDDMLESLEGRSK